MKFRSNPPRTPEFIHLSTTLALAAVVGPEWRELPLGLHRPALASGCVTDNMTEDMQNQPPDEPVVPAAPNGFDRSHVIGEAVKTLLEQDGTDGFTAEGVPDLVALSKLAGFEVDRQEMFAAWNALNKEAA